MSNWLECLRSRNTRTNATWTTASFTRWPASWPQSRTGRVGKDRQCGHGEQRPAVQHGTEMDKGGGHCQKGDLERRALDSVEDTQRNRGAPNQAEADDGRMRDARPAVACAIARTRRRTRATACDCHDRRLDHLDALHVARFTNVLFARREHHHPDGEGSGPRLGHRSATSPICPLVELDSPAF